MARNILTFSVLAVLVYYCPGCLAQTNNDTLSCDQAVSMAVNATLLAGTWYEVARSPAGNAFCVEVNFTPQSDNVLEISATYSNTPLFPWVNQTINANITLNSGDTDGYNITYSPAILDIPTASYKILDTDYNNYTFVCGYRNATSFGMILTRDRTPTTEVLNSFQALAAAKYSNFQNGTMAVLLQSDKCYANLAFTLAPRPNMYAVLAVFYAVLSCIY